MSGSGNTVHYLVLSGLLSLAGIVYFPALDSLFLLDDLYNLKDLSEIHTRGPGFYLFGSQAGPGGRPLSLLTFALQYQSWPGDAFAFKLVNLLLHLANGILIYYFCTLIFSAFNLRVPGRHLFALTVTGIWLLHPLQLSTVLYVVQRMSVLATTFVLLGMVIYLRGRKAYLQQQTRKTLILAVSGVYLCMLLAILSKESGVLLPLYLLVVEFTLLSSGPSDFIWRKAVVPALLLPLAVFSLYLLNGYQGLLAAYQIRDYSVEQRLLTEANILLDYLRLIVLPVSGSFSVFHDDYRIATDILSPPRTLISMTVIFVLIVTAFVGRKHAKVFSFAVLWYFAGHLLESTFIGLELYFEHRNYLPSAGVLVFVLWTLFRITEKLPKGPVRPALIPAYLTAVFIVTLMEVNLWSQPYLQAHEWVREHPGSKRALNNLLNISLMTGKTREAGHMLTRLQEMDNLDIYPVIKEIGMRSCFEIQIPGDTDWNNYNNRAEYAEFRGISVISELNHLVYLYTHGNCTALEINNLAAFTDTLTRNPRFAPVRGQLHELATTFAVLQGKLDVALSQINQSLTYMPLVDSKIYKLRILMARSEWGKSALILDDIKDELLKKPGEYLFYRNMITDLERQLQNAERDGLE